MISIRFTRIAAAMCVTAALGLAGCVEQQPYSRPYNSVTYQQPSGRGGLRQCDRCGVVQDIQQVYTQGSNNSGLGTVLGAVAGGILGSTIGHGDGRTAATVVGAVAGGAVGNQVGARSGGGNVAFRIVIAMDDGRQAVVTQREDAGVRNGDYVIIRNDHVYLR
jgi:outer membrane lipoprotein SlyB